MDSIDDEILELLENCKYGLSIDEISEKLKKSRTTSARALDRLIASGKILRRNVATAKIHILPKYRDEMMTDEKDN